MSGERVRFTVTPGSGGNSITLEQKVPSSQPAYWPPRGWRRWLPGARSRARADHQRRIAEWEAAGRPPVILRYFIPRAGIKVMEGGL